MIKINLALKKGPVGSTDNKPDFKNAFRSIDFGILRELPLKKIALTLSVAVLSSYVLDDYKQKELMKLDTSIQQFSSEQSKLRAELAKTKGYEEVKRQLDADEVMIRTKIETIQKLIADRAVLPKVLLTLSGGIPTEVWLSDFKVANEDVAFKGSSLGFNQISDFMRNLNESAYFTDLHLINTQQGKDDVGADVAQFELSAKRR
ncbi:MAG: PilN domain-containing protein [Bdellovibrionota bacterium]